MKNFLHPINKNVFNIGNILLFFFVISCFLSRLDLKLFYIDIFGQLSFQILLGGIILSFIFFILKRLYLSIFCILICVLFSIDIFSYCDRCTSSIVDRSKYHNRIRLMTFNVYYKSEFKNFDNLREIILLEKPDIIQFQEVNLQMAKNIKSLKSIFPYSFGLNKPIEFFDSVILSKHPITDSEFLNNNIILVKLIIDEKELTILGVHLKNTFTPGRFSTAVQVMDYLKILINNINHNLILIGDLNMTPVSKRFENFLNETDLFAHISNRNPTFTWPTFLPFYFGIEIDHVLFSKNFKMIRKKTIDHLDFGSDHRPLIVDLVF